jgi:hypothetical protein
MPEPSNVDKQRIVDALNRKYATTLPIDVVEMSVAIGFASWGTLAADADVDPIAPAPTLLGHPVRLDATLCAPDEVWIEGPTGDAVRVWPDPEKEPNA